MTPEKSIVQKCPYKVGDKVCWGKQYSITKHENPVTSYQKAAKTPIFAGYAILENVYDFSGFRCLSDLHTMNTFNLSSYVRQLSWKVVRVMTLAMNLVLVLYLKNHSSYFPPLNMSESESGRERELRKDFCRSAIPWNNYKTGLRCPSPTTYGTVRDIYGK